MIKEQRGNTRMHKTVGQRIFGRGDNNELRYRAHEAARIEALSDAVFAFSISLLIMSLEVPQTFKELQHTIYSFLPFVATVALVFLFWYEQYRFFRIYGLNDKTIIVLNASLLVLVLFYVYPLKFLFSLLFAMITRVDYFPKATAQHEVVLTQAEFPQLVLIYSAGYAAIWLVFYLMYHHAWKKRVKLILNSSEIQDMHKQMRGALLNIAVGLAGAFFGWLSLPAAGGLCFVLILPFMMLNNWYSARQLKKLKHV